MKTKINLIVVLFLCQYISAQEIRTLDFYKTLAKSANTALLENKGLAQYYLLQNNLSIAQLRKPQLNVSADYLFAPFFFNHGQFISITQNPEHDAYGYDINLSNGGLYALQFNASLPLLTGKLTNVYLRQNSVQSDLLQYKSSQVSHELEKTIADQYVAVYQLEQQILYQQNIGAIVEGRKKIAEQLVQKGLMSQNDFLLLEIEIKQREFDIEQLRINLVAAFTQLNTTCLISDTTIYTLQTPIIVQSIPKSNFNYQAKYAIDSVSIVAQEQVFNTKYLPQLSAFGNAGLAATNTADMLHNTGISAGLHFVFPIYDGAQRKVVAKQNSILLQNLQYYQKQYGVTISNNLADLQIEIDLTAQSISLLGSQLSTQETLLEIIKDKVVTGQVSVTDYLNALKDYATANQNKILAVTNLWLLINQYNFINW